MRVDAVIVEVVSAFVRLSENAVMPCETDSVAPSIAPEADRALAEIVPDTVAEAAVIAPIVFSEVAVNAAVLIEVPAFTLPATDRLVMVRPAETDMLTAVSEVIDSDEDVMAPAVR